MGSVGSGVAGEQEFAMKSVEGARSGGEGEAGAREGAGEGEGQGEGTGENREGEDREGEGAREGERAGEGTGEAGEREREIQAAGLDACGNIVGRGANEKSSGENNPGSHNPPNHNPPKILPVSGKLEQNNSGLVRPSAFKPVVPKSFHSMQNLVGQAGGAGSEGKTEARSEGTEGGGSGIEVVQGGMSDSGRNSLTSLPTYTGSGSGCGPPAVLGPLSASTSHINRLGMVGATAGLDKLEKPGYQNGLSASDSGRSSSGKSSSSYQRLSHLSDAPAPLRPSPSSDDVIQDLEDRLWEKEQEVQHMRRNLDQSEAAIIQVFEEKQRVWERQMDELRQNYASRLQQVTRRAQRSQTALQAQIGRLSQDKRRLQEEMAALLAQREELERKCLDYRKEQADILPRLEETKWEVCQKAGEISLLKQQLRESQAEVTQRAGEMVALRGQLKELNAQLREREETMLGLKDSYSTKSVELEKCEGELRRTLLKRALNEVSRGAEEAQLCHEAQMRQEAQLRHEAQLCQEVQLRQDGHQPQRGQEGHWDEAGELRRQLEQLQAALRLERQQRERQALNFDHERHTWQDEKERVLKYQAQLQLSYVETLQKNQALEKRMTQLGAKPNTTPHPLSLAPSPSPSPLPVRTRRALRPSRLERIESTEI
uniref:Leucine zipper, putative tumor suppressor family member 3b n=1 Tax=Gasterosteus aculeatus TaxID=69293 RepID=G3NTZ6_GASAC